MPRMLAARCIAPQRRPNLRWVRTSVCVHFYCLERAEQAVLFAVYARREVQRVRAGGQRTPELESPQSLDHDCMPARIAQLSEQLPVGAESADTPVAEVTDENIAAESAEGVRGARLAPRRIERTPRGEAPQQVTVGIEHVDETVTFACDIVVLLCILQRVRHKEITVDGADAERCVSGRNVWIGE